jgi:hypothetical protein
MQCVCVCVCVCVSKYDREASVVSSWLNKGFFTKENSLPSYTVSHPRHSLHVI